MKIILILLFVCVISAEYGYAQKKNGFDKISLEATPAYLKINGQEQRMAILYFNNGTCEEEAVVEIIMNGKSAKIFIPEGSGLWKYELALPSDAVDVAAQLLVKLTTSSNTFEASTLVQPTRKWTVYLLHQAHVDIGYTHNQSRVLKGHIDNIEDAIELGEQSKNFPKEARSSFITEVTWVADEYLKGAGQTNKDRFWNAIKNGSLEVGNCYTNMNTSNVSTEGLLRSYEYAAKMKKEHGIAMDNMYQGDIPGASWGVPALADITDTKYFLMAHNGAAREGKIKQWENVPFYWVSPSGKEKVLTWIPLCYGIGWQLRGDRMYPLKEYLYAPERVRPIKTGRPLDNFLNPFVFGYLDQQAKKGLPYDRIIIPWSTIDNGPLDIELPESVKLWNERYAWPKLVMTTSSNFFAEFEAKYKNQIPEVRGDMTEFWTDGVGSGAYQTAMNRTNGEKLQQMEALCAIDKKRKFQPTEFESAWKKVLLFAEHTWGAGNSVEEPDRDMVKEQWRVKESYAMDADKLTTALQQKVVGVPDNSFDVFNTTAFNRTDLVSLSATQSKGKDLVISDKGEVVPSQRLSTGELFFVAQNIAPLSAARFSLKAGEEVKVGMNSEKPVKEIENEFYRVAIDPKNVTFSELYSKKLNKSLISNDTLLMNQYLYLLGGKQDTLQKAVNGVVEIVESGKVLSRLRVTSDAPGCKGKLVTEVTLAMGIDRIDIKNTLDKKAVRIKEGVHFAFPFNVPNSVVRYNTPASYVTVESEIVDGFCKNWFTIQRWVNVSNSDYGVNWCSLDAPLMEIGGITANLIGHQTDSPNWITKVKPSPTILSWALNNHWFTNFRADQEGKITFRYAINAYNGGFKANRSDAFGITTMQPLIVSVATGKLQTSSLFTLSGDKEIYIDHVKPSADGKGYIVRLVNPEDKLASVKIHQLGSQLLTCWKTNLTEDKVDVLSSDLVVNGRGFLLMRVE